MLVANISMTRRSSQSRAVAWRVGIMPSRESKDRGEQIYNIRQPLLEILVGLGSLGFSAYLWGSLGALGSSLGLFPCLVAGPDATCSRSVGWGPDAISPRLE
jgi:hypothetical protein